MKHLGIKTWLALGLAVGAGALHASAQSDVPAEPYTWRSVTIKANGFIDGVVFSPAQQGLVYMHTDMGGAYRLDGDQWVPLTDWITHDDWSLNQNGVETMAADPNDANKVYAGVGTYMGPSAVLRSDDQGRTWQRTDVPFGMNGNGSARQAGERMNVDPNQTNRLVYGTRDKGLWESNDSGATWTQIESFPSTGEAQGPMRDTGIVWTLFDKTSGQAGQPTPVIYAGVMTDDADKVFRSDDAGQTWSPLPGQPQSELVPNRVALTPDGQTMYITYVKVDGYPGPHGVNGGAVYKVQNLKSDQPNWTDVSPTKGNFAWSGVSLDVQNPDTVYVSTLCRYGNPGDDIYRTTDGGKTWQPLHINDNRDDSSARYASSMGMHWTGDVQVDPFNPDIAIFTTGFGLYRTTNLTDDTPTWVFYNEGFEQSAVLELVSPTEGSAHLLSAIGDRDGYRHEDFSVSPVHGLFGQPNDVGQTERMSMGTSPDIDVARNKPDLVVRVGGPAQYSNDGGLTWHWFTAPEQQQEGQENRRGGLRGGSIGISADGNTVVWAPSRANVVYATRDGDGWSDWQATEGAPQGGSMVTADPLSDSTFYLRDNEALYKSTDGGQTWSKQGDLPEQPHWLRAVPGQEGHLWLTSGDAGSGGLSRSTDGGQTWTRVQPDQIVVAKQVGVGAPAEEGGYPAIFIGGTINDVRGFFRSDDAGETWVRVNDDAHQYGNVTVINGDSRVHGRLFVGTNGRGILYGEPAAE